MSWVLEEGNGGGSSNDKGYFVDQAALEAAYPVGEAGWYAVVGSTDTVWIWDTDSEAWVDSGVSTMGTVTSVSIVSANGLAGSVANPTSTPAITLSTSVTGLLKGNGTAISAAVAGTDYFAPGENLDLEQYSLIANGVYLKQTDPEENNVSLRALLGETEIGRLTFKKSDPESLATNCFLYVDGDDGNLFQAIDASAHRIFFGAEAFQFNFDTGVFSSQYASFQYFDGESGFVDIVTSEDNSITNKAYVDNAIAGLGGVTSVSVVTANGFAGDVATSTTTPAITIKTTVTGLLKGDGTAISQATAGTDYLTPTGNGSGLTNLSAAQVTSTPFTGIVANDVQEALEEIYNAIPSTSGFVPYTGATANLNLGSNILTASGIYSSGGLFSSAANNATFFTPTFYNGEVGFTFQNATTVYSQLICNQYSDPTTPSKTEFRFFAPKGSGGDTVVGSAVSLVAGVFAGINLGASTYSVDSTGLPAYRSYLYNASNLSLDFLRVNFTDETHILLTIPCNATFEGAINGVIDGGVF